MEELIRQVLDWVGRNPGWSYAAVFCVAMTESLAVIGVLVPGVIMLIGTGALIATGAIGFWPAFAAAAAGAIVGDGLSFAVGRHFDSHIRSLWPFTRYPDQLDRGVAFFERYGGWSVAFARFAGPGRAIVPLVAGMLRMHPRRFYVANIASALVQTLVFFLPGMIFGASLKLAAEAAVRLSILAAVLVVLLWLAIWLARRVYALVSPHASAWLRGLLGWADLHPIMGRVAHALADPDHPDARTLTGLAFLLVLGVFLTGALAGLTLLGAPDLALNRSTLDLGQSLHTPLGNRLMAALARLGEPATLLPAVAAVLLYLRWQGRLRNAYYWLAAAGFALAATPVLGALLPVPRPDLGLGLSPPWSFPSGPTLLATTVYGFLAVSLAASLPERVRWLPYALASALIGAVAWSRLYFGAEWLTDVVGSIALGLAWISALGLAYRRHGDFDSDSGLLAVVVATTLSASMAANTWLFGSKDLARYTPDRPLHILDRSGWVAGEWRRLPTRRDDLSQRDRHPLTLQYAGDPEALARGLASAGWEPAQHLEWSNAIRLLSPSLPLRDLPVIPQVHDGRHEALGLVRTDPDGKRRVLRLWSSAWRLADGAPLWVGNVTGQHKETVLGLVAFPATDPEDAEIPSAVQTDLDALADRLPNGSQLLKIPPG